jgi:uncharacterized protein YjbI with pentapeptide repeats
MDNYFENKEYKNIDFSVTKIHKGEYDHCRFINCNFENSHISKFEFVEVEFIDCNFSNANIKETAFKEVSFYKCKMIGLRFHECDPFLLQFSFKECQLSFSSFFQLKIPSTQFISCNLQEVDFTETILTTSVFDCCDLKGAIFDSSNLEKSDFRTAFNFTINPENNKLKGGKYRKENISGLLNNYKIVIE